VTLKEHSVRAVIELDFHKDVKDIGERDILEALQDEDIDDQRYTRIVSFKVGKGLKKMREVL
jgi:hypothetical protein